MKCTEMFSVSETNAKKAVKKTPSDVIRSVNLVDAEGM